MELENLVLTHRWTLRETDLWNYSLSLQEIDRMRVDGKFVDSEGNRPSGQYVRLLIQVWSILLRGAFLGFALHAEALLRSYLSIIIVERAGLRRTHANRMSSPQFMFQVS
jgi:hypothetical protein